MGMPCLLFILTIVYLSHYSCTAQDIHIDSVKTPKEEPWGRIRGMAQDPQGFLWLASDGGLVKYDGYKTMAYYHEPSNPNSLANEWVESIYGGMDSFILLGTYGSGLDRFDLSTGNFTHYRYNAKDPTTLSNDTVTAIIKDKQGFFWIGTHNGLNRFDPKSGKFTRYKNNPDDRNSLSDNQVRVLYEDHSATIWIGTKSPWVHDGGARIGGLNRFVPQTGKFIRYMHSSDTQSLVDNEITAIFEDSKGTFWVGTAGDGLHTMNRDKGTFKRHPYDAAHSEKLSRPPIFRTDTTHVKDYITFIKEDIKGNIWIGTFSGGINVYDPLTAKATHYGSDKISKQKLAVNYFSTAYRSRDGILWISSWNDDLYKINPYKTAIPHNTIGKPATGFYEESNGVLWITTMQGLFKKNKDGTVQQFLIDKKVPSVKNVMYNAMFDVVQDNDNNLWIAAVNGLQRFNPITQTFSGYHHDAGKESTLICDSVITLGKAGNNKFWVGTYHGLDLMDIQSGTFKHYVHNPKDSTSLGGFGFSDEGVAYVSSITTAGNNKVWVIAGGAVNLLDIQTGRFKKFASIENAECIMEDSEGRTWVGTWNGLYRYNKETDHFTPFYDLLKVLNRNIHIYRITEDHQKNLWLKTTKELIKLNVQKKEASVYENNESSFSWDVLGSYITKSGEILSGDTSGYFAFYPDSLLKGTPSPNVVVTGFSLSDQAVKQGNGSVLSQPIYLTKEIRLKYNQNVFSFEFTSIDFSGNSENRHLVCLLENYDTKWHKADAEGTANYYNIPPGKYIFKVKAMNSNGMWAEKDIAVTVTPPWWTTWWAYVLYGLCFLATVFAVDRIQRRRLIAKERERSKEKELAQAREIEKAYNELKRTQTQLIQSEKMASLGELTAGIAHEIQNPLNFVNNFSEVNTELIEELKGERSKAKGERNEELEEEILNDIKENEQKINHHGKRADAIVKGMLQHSQKSTGKKEPIDINALADEYLRLSYHGLRAKDKDFNADFKTDFDESIGKIEAAPQDIGRVLLNLYNNAFYAVNEKKKQLDGTFEPTVEVTTKRVGNKIELSVIDNGVGIPQKILDKIYQPFFTTKPTGQGTGLGLSLSYDIVKAHGGDIKVESKEGEFSNFILVLPAFAYL